MHFVAATGLSRIGNQVLSWGQFATPQRQCAPNSARAFPDSYMLEYYGLTCCVTAPLAGLQAVTRHEAAPFGRHTLLAMLMDQSFVLAKHLLATVQPA